MYKKISTLLIFFVFTTTGFAKLPVAKQFSKEFAKVAKAVNPAVVTVTSEKVVKGFNHPFQEFFSEDFFNQYKGPNQERRSKALGSGVIVDSRNGYILTNNHVVEGAEEITILLIDEREYRAEIVGTDPKSDVAVLKIDASDLVSVELGDSDILEVGEWVLAIGSPFSKNLSHTVTAGIVSAKGRSSIINGTNYEDFIQTDAAINPGNSGGALVNLDGELIGINSAIATAGFSRGNVGVGFAIPINYAKSIMDDLINEGRVIRSWLGVYIQDVNDGLAKALDLDSREGVLINNIMDDSPAKKAGIKVEDVIIKFNGAKVKDTAHLKQLVSTTRPGTRVDVEVVRKKKIKTIEVDLDELPGDEEIIQASHSPSNPLGLKVENLDARMVRELGIDEGEGVVVVNVAPKSYSAKAGIRPGDVIKRVGDSNIANVKEFQLAIDEHKSDDIILLLIKRRGGSLFVPVENQ